MQRTDSPATAHPLAASVRRAMEALWLLAAGLVPLMVLPLDWSAYAEAPKVLVFRAIALLLLALWLFEWALTPRSSQTPRAPARERLTHWFRASPGHWIIAFALLYFAVFLISALLSPVLQVSLMGRDPGRDDYSLLAAGCYLILFLVIVTHVRRREQVQRLFWVVAGAAALNSIYGIAQEFGADPILPDHPERQPATFGNPIFFGSFLVLALPLGLAAVFSLGDRVRLPVHALSLAALLGVQTTALAFTLSRGPWVGAAVALATFLILAAIVVGRRTAVLALSALALAIAVTIGLDAIPSGDNEPGTIPTGERLASVADIGGPSGLGGRATIWKDSLELMARQPWFDRDEFPELPARRTKAAGYLFGYGPEMFLAAYPLADDVQPSTARERHAHDFYLHAGVELGWLGFIAVVGLFAAIGSTALWALRQVWRRREQGWLALAVVAIAAAMAGRFAEQLAGLAQVSDLTLFWMLAGVLAVLPRMLEGQAPEPAPRAASDPTQALRLGVALAALAGLGFILWYANIRFFQASVSGASASEAIDRGDAAQALREIDGAIDLAPEGERQRAFRNEVLDEIVGVTRDQAQVRRIREDQRANAREMINRDPLSHLGWRDLANVTRELAFIDRAYIPEAGRSQEVLTALLPAYWLSHNALALRHLEFGDPQQAVLELQRSMELNGRYPPTLFLLAQAYARLNRMDEAIATAEESLATDPEHGDAMQTHRLLADLYSSKGDRAQASRHSAQFLFFVGRDYAREGNTPLAIQALEDSLRLDPEHPQAAQARALLQQLRNPAPERR